jgi:hypothetical protein
MNDAGSSWLGPISVQDQTLSNTTCSIAYGSVVGAGTTLTATYTMNINTTANMAANGNIWTSASSPANPAPSWVVQGTYAFASTGATITLLPSLPGETVTDDYSGAPIVMPTSDSPTTQFNWTSSQGNWPTTEVHASDTFTTTIDYGPANTPVFVKVYSTTTGAAAFWFTPNCATLQPCQIGTTDSSGHFSYSGSWNGFGNDNYAEQWYVGNPGVLVETSTNPIVFQVGANFVGSAAYTVIAAGQPVTMSIEHSLTMANKARKTFRRPHFKRRPEVSSAYRELDGGKLEYTFSVDTTEAELIRVGDNIGYVLMPEENPHASANGWMFTGVGWGRIADDAERGPGTDFVMLVDWRPGPVDVMIQGKESRDSFNMAGNTSWDNVRIAKQMSIRNNSLRTTVIGPAIPPGATHEQLQLLIRQWVAFSNLGFLQPMTQEGADLEKILPTLHPKTDLEKQIVQCIKEAL